MGLAYWYTHFFPFLFLHVGEKIGFFLQSFSLPSKVSNWCIYYFFWNFYLKGNIFNEYNLFCIVKRGSSVHVWHALHKLFVIRLCCRHLKPFYFSYLFFSLIRLHSCFLLLHSSPLRKHGCEVWLLSALGPFVDAVDEHFKSSRWLLWALKAWIFTFTTLYSLDGAVKQSTPGTPLCLPGPLEVEFH